MASTQARAKSWLHGYVTVVAVGKLANVGREGEHCTHFLALGDEDVAVTELLGELQGTCVELGAEEVVFAPIKWRRQQDLGARRLVLQVQLTDCGNRSAKARATTNTALNAGATFLGHWA